MAKITLSTVSASNLNTLVGALNANFDIIEAAVENTLSRNGDTPNTMGAELDMNSERIINLSAPLENTEPVRKAEFDPLAGSISSLQNSINNLNLRFDWWVGVHPSDPEVDDLGQVYSFDHEGYMYWNSTTNHINIWDGTQWIDLEANITELSEDVADMVAPFQAHLIDTSNPHATTKAQVGLGNADNTSDANKPVSTAQATALALKAPLASPAFTGTPTGITKAHVGLGSVDNTTDTAKPVSTAQQTALNLKANLSNPAFSGYIDIAEIAAPTTPSTGFSRAYVKSDGKLYIKNDSGAETEVGSGGSGVAAFTTPEAFGAVGDGTTDDTAAINAAEVYAASNGKLLIFSGKTYIVTGVTKLSGTIWQGAGFGKTVLKLKANTTTESVILTSGATALWGTNSKSGVSDFTIRDMTIDGNRLNNSVASGISIYGHTYSVTGVEVKFCTGRGIRAEYPIAVDGDIPAHSDNASAWIEKCLIHECDTNGIEFAGPQDSCVSFNYVYCNLGINIWIKDAGVACKLTQNHTWGSHVDQRQAYTGLMLDAGGCKVVGGLYEGSMGQQIWVRSYGNVLTGFNAFYANQINPNRDGLGNTITVYGVRLGDTANNLGATNTIVIGSVDNCESGAVFYDKDMGTTDVRVVGINYSPSPTVGWAGTPSAYGNHNIVMGTGGGGTNLILNRSYGDMGLSGGLFASGPVLSFSPTGGIGYTTGAGGGAAQATSKATGVTLNKATGRITLNAAALAANTSVSFVLTNSAIAANDFLIVQHVGAGTPGAYAFTAMCGAGAATITVRNVTAGSLSEAIVLGFALVKSATS